MKRPEVWPWARKESLKEEHRKVLGRKVGRLQAVDVAPAVRELPAAVAALRDR